MWLLTSKFSSSLIFSVEHFVSGVSEVSLLKRCGRAEDATHTIYHFVTLNFTVVKCTYASDTFQMMIKIDLIDETESKCQIIFVSRRPLFPFSFPSFFFEAWINRRKEHTHTLFLSSNKQLIQSWMPREYKWKMLITRI